MRRSITVAIGVLLFCALVIHLEAATITVTNTNDSGAGSLRQALSVAHDGDRITFAVSGTITLTSGALVVTKNVTISGPGANQLSIDGNREVLVFEIFPGKTATISGLTIRNAEGGAGVWNEQGTLTVSDCAVTSNSYQGLYNHEGTLNVNNCVLSGNSGDGLYTYYGVTTVSNCVVSGNSSGGLVNDGPHNPPNDHSGSAGSMTIDDSMISDNSGPGVSNVAGFLTVLNSTLSGNSAGQALDGGGIMSGPLFKTPTDVTLINSTISGNSASGFGGGISGGWWGVTIVNSTISGNSAGDSGGGIATGFVSIMNSTISGNSAASGGGIYNTEHLQITNTILNAGASGENIFSNGGTVTSHGYNISSDNGGGYLTGPGDQINTDPLLGPLQDNGGPTLTHALLPGSPAIDAGDPNFTPPPFNDQRGCSFDRVFNGRIDIGSFERQPLGRPCPTPRSRPTPRPRPTPPQ